MTVVKTHFSAAAAIGLAFALISKAEQVIRANPDGTTNRDTYALNQPGFNQNGPGIEIYSESDKEHVFSAGPSSVMDPSSLGTAANFSGQLSPGQQKSVGIQFGIPGFGSPESVEKAGRAENHASDSGVTGPLGRSREP